MEPEGSSNNNSNDVSDSTKPVKTSRKKVMKGDAIWTYRKPIFTAVVIPKNGQELDFDMDEDDTSTSSIDTAPFDMPDLIPMIEKKQQEEQRPAEVSSSSASTSTMTTTTSSSSSSSITDNNSILAVTTTAPPTAPTRDEAADEWLLTSLYKYSLIFGLLVGCFIQSSSLGANYILMIVFGRNFAEMAKHHSDIVTFSLAWSFLTSLMGIVILLILRSLVSLATHGLNQNNVVAGRPTIFLNRQLSLVAFLEFPFAFGALAGVCGSWAATDVVLGLHSHAYHSLVTLSVACLGKMIFECCSKTAASNDEDDDDEEVARDSDNVDDDKWSNTKPLLTSQRRKHADEKIDNIHKEFKVKGLATGLLVGFFIQFSSLGASFLIDALVSSKGDGVDPVTLSKQSLLLFSLGWSFVFGTMGVTILLLLRYLVGIVCDHILSQSQGTESETDEEEEMADRWSVSLEFFFAVGCLVGVNIAWLITDVGLGLNAHVWRSLATLGAAAVWCCVLAHCFGFNNGTLGGNCGSNNKRRKIMVTKATQTTDGGLMIV